MPRISSSLLPAFVVVLLAVGACDGGRAEPNEASTTTELATTTEGTTPPPCHNPDGGVCLGPLEAGSYSTRSFDPDITYTVPDAWENLEDLPGNFLLQKIGDERYVAIYQNVRAPAECEETWASGVGAAVADLVDWYTTHPGLNTTQPQTVTVGGLTGVFLDISLDPSWNVTCSYSQGQPVVPLIIGNGTSLVHHVILPGFEERLYLLEWNGGNVAIEIGTEGMPLDEYLTEVVPIIETLSFGE
jgi:hypothetical protein